MYTNFTDAENTGAPIVPLMPTDDDEKMVADGGTIDEDYRENVLSHRLQD